MDYPSQFRMHSNVFRWLLGDISWLHIDKPSSVGWKLDEKSRTIVGEHSIWQDD